MSGKMSRAALVLTAAERRCSGLVGFCFEIVIRVGLKVMLQVLPDHLVRHLPYRRTEVPLGPEVPTQLEIPYGCHICSPCRTSSGAAYFRS